MHAHSQHKCRDVLAVMHAHKQNMQEGGLSCMLQKMLYLIQCLTAAWSYLDGAKDFPYQIVLWTPLQDLQDHETDELSS